MQIVKPSQTIFLKEFTSLKKISDGEALPSSYYDVTEPTTVSARLIPNTGKIIETDTDSTNMFYEGEEVLIKDSNGIFRKNIISAIGLITDTEQNVLTYELIEDIEASFESETEYNLEIKRINKTIAFTDLPEDEYYIIPTNEKLVCRSTFASIHINYSDFVVFYPDSKNYNEFEHEKMINVALSDVYADLSGYQDFYNIIHFASLEQLVRLKMMCLISNRFATQNTQIQEETPCRKYEKALNNFIVKLKLVNNSDNTPSSSVPKSEFSGGYSL